MRTFKIWRMKIALFWGKLKFLWLAINTEDDDVKKQLLVAESNIRKSIELKEKLKNLDPKDQEVYSYLREMKLPDSMKDGLLQASRTVRKWNREEEEQFDLYNKQELVDAITTLFEEYVDKKIDLAVRIRERHKELNSVYEIKNELDTAFKMNYAK